MRGYLLDTLWCGSSYCMLCIPGFCRWLVLTVDMQGARVASEMAYINSTTDVTVLGCIFFSYPLHTADNLVREACMLCMHWYAAT